MRHRFQIPVLLRLEDFQEMLYKRVKMYLLSASDLNFLVNMNDHTHYWCFAYSYNMLWMSIITLCNLVESDNLKMIQSRWYNS